MTRSLFLVIICLFAASQSFSRDYKINSPDRKTGITIIAGNEIQWSVSYDGKEIFRSVKIAMVLADGRVLGENEKVTNSTVNQLHEIIRPVVSTKRSEITDNCNILSIYFKSGFSVEFRAYNDGVAYRFETLLKGNISVSNEISELLFPAGSHSWYPLETSFMSHNERTFIYSSLDTIGENHLASLPALFQTIGVNI